MTLCLLFQSAREHGFTAIMDLANLYMRMIEFLRTTSVASPIVPPRQLADEQRAYLVSRAHRFEVSDIRNNNVQPLDRIFRRNMGVPYFFLRDLAAGATVASLLVSPRSLTSEQGPLHLPNICNAFMTQIGYAPAPKSTISFRKEIMVESVLRTDVGIFFSSVQI